ncbi:MAG: DUF3060 domain-containing protein [Archangiaceae bacterium]|nr:DUF3060 domain-containing protein [Archangiaceae bacterium]
MFRLVLLTSCLASIAFAQVTVTGKNGKTVKVGAGGVEVQNATGKVKVNTGGTSVKVESDDEKTVEVDDDGVAPTAAKDGTWLVEGQGRTETHACAANEDVRIEGQGHTITLTGPCRTITVNGQGSVVTTDVAAKIEANGMNNQVKWKKAATGKKPVISLSGMNNGAPQVK